MPFIPLKSQALYNMVSLFLRYVRFGEINDALHSEFQSFFFSITTASEEEIKEFLEYVEEELEECADLEWDFKQDMARALDKYDYSTDDKTGKILKSRILALYDRVSTIN